VKKHEIDHVFEEIELDENERDALYDFIAECSDADSWQADPARVAVRYLAQESNKAHRDFQEALYYLRQAKKTFAPTTTNSFVDSFLERHKDVSLEGYRE